MKNGRFAPWLSLVMAWVCTVPVAGYLQLNGIPVWSETWIEAVRAVVPMVDRVAAYPGASREEVRCLLAYAWSLSPILLWVAWGSSVRYTVPLNKDTAGKIVGAIALVLFGLFYFWYWPRNTFWNEPLGPLTSPLDARRKLFGSLFVVAWTAPAIVSTFVICVDSLICTVRRALQDLKNN